jgi:translocation and assembly module TamA
MSIPNQIRHLVWILLLTTPAWGYAEFNIKGLGGDAEENVKLTLSLAKENCESPEWKVRQLFNKAEDEIDQAMRAIGYYHASSNNQLKFAADCWQADFEIQPGPPVKIDRIDISINGEAANDEEFNKLKERLSQSQGKILHHGHYEKMKAQLESLAMERGYLHSHFVEKTLQVDKEHNIAEIKLVFDSGHRLTFGEIVIDQDILEPEFINKFISVKTGEFYTSSDLAKTHNDLSSSGYFDMVDIHPDLEHIDQSKVPVNLKLYPKKIHHYSAGVGYDTDKGPLVSGSYNNRRLNRDGHFLTSEIDLSPVLSTADIAYNVPLGSPLTEVFSFGGGLKREDTDTYNSLSAKITARLKQSFESGWKQTLYVDEVYERFDAADDEHDQQNIDTLLLLPGGSWLLSVIDNPLRPTQGYRLEFNLAGTYENPLSEISLLQGSVAGVWTQSLPWNGRIVARAQQAATWVSEFYKLPTTYRYYAGGINTIRGYAYKELGPKNQDGDVIGGRYLSVGSLEYEQGILENWGIAAFVDSGNAYNMNDIQIKTGVGLGVRWYSPIGLVRVDFAVPLDQSDSAFQFHFAAGSRI